MSKGYRTLAELEHEQLCAAIPGFAELPPWEQRKAAREYRRKLDEPVRREHAERHAAQEWEDYKRTVSAKAVQSARDMRNALISVVRTFKAKTVAERAVMAQCRAALKMTTTPKPKSRGKVRHAKT